MKRQIRSGVFETNSSSTHSIAIPRSCSAVSDVQFNIDEFGWSFNEANAADYLYTAIYATAESESEAAEKIRKLENILNNYGITCSFGPVESHTWHSDYSNTEYFSLDNGYIDHAYELKELVEELLNDDEKLVRFLSGGLVFTGNDNSNTEERCFIERYEEYLDDYDWKTGTAFKVKNPYYMSNHTDYEWRYKGN